MNFSSKFNQKSSHLFINCGSLFLACVLFISSWKKKTIRKNEKIAAIKVSRFKLYKNAAADLLCFLLATPLRPYEISPRDKKKLQELKSSGGLLLCAHFHNWELMGAWLRKNGLDILGYAQELKQGWANSILLRCRKKIDLPTVCHNVPQKATSWIQEKKVFGLLWDQHYPGLEAVFFNQRAHSSNLPSYLVQNSGCPAYFCAMGSNGKIRLIMLTRNGEVSGEKLLLRYHKALETTILKEPHFWYGWFHNRFKNLAEKETVSRETQPEFRERFHVKPQPKVG